MNEKLQAAFREFDTYNSRDPHTETFEGKTYPKELLYALRMSDKLNQYHPGSPEAVQLAARCQHIGRWEVPRNTFPMDRKGYLQWRSKLALYHSSIAGKILASCGYEKEVIEKVKFLLQKKELFQHNPETQLLEDVICLVFIEYYLEDFASQHDDEKVVDILRKTIKKMSPDALQAATSIKMTDRIKGLITQAAG